MNTSFKNRVNNVLQKWGALGVLFIFSAFLFNQDLALRLIPNLQWNKEAVSEGETFEDQHHFQEQQVRELPPPDVFQAVRQEVFSPEIASPVFYFDFFKIETTCSSKKSIVVVLYILFHSWKHFLS